MNYISMKVKEAMRQISQGEIYLPAIQRKFVWGPDRIERLFDSIMRGYPIGTFLFWFVEGRTKNEYTFYRFIQDYHERDRALNDVAPKPHLGERFIGVLDGQQRLNSMYVALQGSYAFKRKHGRWNDDGAFPRRSLYVNLFFEPGEDDETGVAYQFSFLTKEQAAKVDESHFWFLVKKILDWEDLGPLFRVIKALREQHPAHEEVLNGRGAETLTLLFQRLCSDDVINYFKVEQQELDRIVEIFIRVNSAGVQLSKTDLLFSSIVAHWDEGRSEIEATIKTLNEKGSGFAFDNDFVMRTCLALADLPIRFKVNSFKKENIERIKELWPATREALEDAVDLLVQWGFSRETLPALNAVIPIAYFCCKGGEVEASRNALRQYLLRALLNQIFRSKTDQVLGAIREHLRKPTTDGQAFELRTPMLSVRDVVTAKLPDDRTLQIGEEDVDEFLSNKKGAYTFILLSLLYPQLKFEQVQFHQDHIHPFSQFSSSRLKEVGLDRETIERWQEDRDRLPNLQLMEGSENKSKNATPLKDWIASLGPAQDHFLQANYIPTDVSLSLADFDQLSGARRRLLRERLVELLLT